MRRPAATIVIPAWNEWGLTRDCLASLRPTLGVHDTVVVVDNGSRDGTAAGLAKQRWVTVVTNEENRGFAAACNQGAALATGEVVVFLNNDTLVTGRWLDSLLAPFGDLTVAATGPRSNMVSGPQLVTDVDYHPERTSELHRFTKAWRDDHRDAVTEVDRLVGFCLAVRRSAFEAIGGFDEGFGIGGCEDDDLCNRLIAEGGRLLIAHESFVHHHGHRTFDANGIDWFALQQENRIKLLMKSAGSGNAPAEGAPLLSACMIVKDEETLLPDCLASLAGLVDEIVVYDTGSTDATVDIVRAAGGTVIEGTWDDDFARARNAALEHCRGEWVLHVDADERVEADPAALRARLSQGGSADALLVGIENRTADLATTAVAHPGARVFRRSRARWAGRLHEQLVPVAGSPLRYEDLDGVVIVHLGYIEEVVPQREKHERNERIARAAVEDGREERSLAYVNLGRAHLAFGRQAEALDCFDQAANQPPPAPARHTALRFGIETLLAMNNAERALEWVDRLRAVSTRQDLITFFEAQARALLGEGGRAVALLRSLTHVEDDDGVVVPDVLLRAVRADALAQVDRTREAVLEMVPALLDESTLATALTTAHRVAGSLAELADVIAPALPPDSWLMALGRLLTVDPIAADEVAERLWAGATGDSRLLAAAVRIGPELSLDRASSWSARLRQAGLTERCPLATLAADWKRPPLERLQAAAVISAAFADPRAAQLARSCASSIPVAELEVALLALDELAPGLLPDFVTAAARGAERTEAIVAVLRRYGATEQADALLGAVGGG